MLSINSNASASMATYAMRQANAGEIRAGERLPSGSRVNSAADDAAGNTVVNKLTKDIQGVKTAIRNSADMYGALSVVDNSYAILDSILIRMRELAIQSSNGTNNAADQATLDLEVQQLKVEIDRISSSTQFNSMNLLDGSFSNERATK